MATTPPPDDERYIASDGRNCIRDVSRGYVFSKDVSFCVTGDFSGCIRKTRIDIRRTATGVKNHPNKSVLYLIAYKLQV